MTKKHGLPGIAKEMDIHYFIAVLAHPSFIHRSRRVMRQPGVSKKPLGKVAIFWLGMRAQPRFEMIDLDMVYGKDSFL